MPHKLIIHGGPDAQGVPLYDFSTNANACGPCPEVLAAVQQADATRYPDPAYTALRDSLGAFHAVAPERIVLAVSASECIHRFTALAALQGAQAVSVPRHSYGDYAYAARARGLAVHHDRDGTGTAGLQWACEPSSPLGALDAQRAHWLLVPDSQLAPTQQPLRVLDCAYAPLRLDGSPPPAQAPGVWQLWTPNKALGLTGERAAYAIAPHADAAGRLAALAPSWPVGAHGVAMLVAWLQPSVQRWLADCLPLLHAWKVRQQTLCSALDWAECKGSTANFFCVRPPQECLPERLAVLRVAGIKLRECSSFGLPGVLRLGVLPPPAQDALAAAWRAACSAHPSMENMQ
ncbi:MAG: aminotransferase class I/II-fold pyridoxal phosphate-dependent enzyme [Giesbergeria sp.]|nr:aminotransferase class I/II-fold pyridoxal phosphate-dependent enzyme [Giesbergeria sp.]